MDKKHTSEKDYLETDLKKNFRTMFSMVFKDVEDKEIQVVNDGIEGRVALNLLVVEWSLRL